MRFVKIRANQKCEQWLKWMEWMWLLLLLFIIRCNWHAYRIYAMMHSNSIRMSKFKMWWNLGVLILITSRREEIETHLKHLLVVDCHFRIYRPVSALLRGRVCIFVRLLFSPISRKETIIQINCPFHYKDSIILDNYTGGKDCIDRFMVAQL